MGVQATDQRGKLSRTDQTARAIVRSWRRLTTRDSRRRAGPGAPTLVACSGGADSCALLLALAAAGGSKRVVVGHVVHDLRPRPEALADRNAVRDLAARFGLPFVEAEVTVAGRAGRNLEDAARTARYRALAAMARDLGIRFVAVGHHAEDQAETVLMSLLRGTGGGGLRGMPSRRRLASANQPLWLIRPMVGEAAITRDACRELCRRAGVQWQEDATNADITRLRSAVRLRVLPVLREIRPDVLERATLQARHAADVAKLLQILGRQVLSRARREHDAVVWPREELRAHPAVVIGEALRGARRVACGPVGADRAGRRSVQAVVRAVRDRCTDPRVFALGDASVHVTASAVRVGRALTSR